MLTNKNSGFVLAEHAEEIKQVFGKRGEEIAKKLQENPQETFLSLLFKNTGE